MTLLSPGTGLTLAADPLSFSLSDEFVDEAVSYLPTVGLFIVGIWLGYLIFGRKKPAAAPEPAVETMPSLPEETRSADSISKLEGELLAARLLEEQQQTELEAQRERLALLGQHLEEKQGRVADLAGSVQRATHQPANYLKLSQSQAPLIYLGEIIRAERQHVGGGLARLQHFEKRLDDESRRLWNCVEKVGGIRNELANELPGTDPDARILITRIGHVDEQLRVLHQNMEGCIQRMTGARTRLQSEQTKLRQAAQPVVEAESELTALAVSESAPDPEVVKSTISKAEARLREVRPLVESLENGFDQEIAEMTGRFDWVVNDSPGNFYKALAQLQESEPARGSSAAGALGEIWGRLAEVKASIAGLKLTLDSGVTGEPSGGHGKRALTQALDQAVATLKTSRKSPAPEEVSEADELGESEGTLAHLQRQLALREGETARLHDELKKRSEKLESLQAELDGGQGAKTETSRDSSGLAGGNFVRRLLGLGPGKQDADSVESDLALIAEGESSPLNPPPATTLAEAREILSELKEASASGNGAHSPDHALPAETKDRGEPVEKELQKLRSLVARRESRIEALEASLAEFQQAGQEKAETRAALTGPELKPETDEQPADTGPASEKGLTGITPGDEVDPGDGEMVIFRGRDPETWDSDFHDSEDHMATPLEHLPDGIRYLRLRRLDTDESIVIPISREELIAGSAVTGKGFGWSGKRERYFGGFHFGIFDESLPREVETKFGAGGWGFGHQGEIGSDQAFAWAGQQIEPTDFEISVGAPIAEEPPEAAVVPVESPGKSAPEKKLEDSGDGLVIFRGNDPGLWNQTSYRGANCRAHAISDLPEDIAWIRVRRLPEGDSIVLPVTKELLTGNGDGQPRGFNGTNEIFYGAHHLGAFDERLPQNVETRFTYGGWGFGHLPAGAEVQACGWAGKEIDRETVFEFKVYRQKPEIDPGLDQVLET